MGAAPQPFDIERLRTFTPPKRRTKHRYRAVIETLHDWGRTAAGAVASPQALIRVDSEFHCLGRVQPLENCSDRGSP